MRAANDAVIRALRIAAFVLAVFKGPRSGWLCRRRANVSEQTVVYAKAYAFTLVVFLGLDFLWLGVVARSFYFSQLGSLMRENVNFIAAGGFYLAYVAGIVFFAVAPALADESWRKAAIHGVLLELLAYGTYDMTNIATLKNWPLAMSIVDIAWGGVLTGVSAVAGFWGARALA